MKFHKLWLINVTLSLLLSSCTLFTSHYDAIRHQNFTRLKAIHLKLFSDWTKGSNKVWNNNSVYIYCDQGDLNFRQAYEYARSKDNADKTGQRAVKILWEEFTVNCALSLKKQKLFSPVFVANLLPEITRNYDYAIAGELTRVNAPE